jgi:hypothetical protein
MAAASAALMLAAAGVLLWRRVAGFLTSPLPWPALLLLGVLVAAIAAAIRAAWRLRSPEGPLGPLDAVVAAVPSTAVLAAGLAVSLPGTSPVGLALLWGILIGEECWFWGPVSWRRRLFRRRSSSNVRGVAPGSTPRETGHPITPIALPEQPPAESVYQQLTRSRQSDGREVLAGWLRVPMAAGQRSANVHVAFCPPFARTPRVEVAQLDGPSARIKTVQVLPFGARFDLKLAAFSDEAAAVLLQFSAEAAASLAADTTHPAGGD